MIDLPFAILFLACFTYTGVSLILRFNRWLDR